MPEKFENKTVFTLLEITQRIHHALAEHFPSVYWVKAEMNKLNHYIHSGHCYPELVEKREGKVVAQIRSNLWKDDYTRINARFLKVLKEPLKDGINILFCAKIAYDPVYGLSLRMVDIDPTYSLGELEREKQESIEKIQQEGLFNRNKSLKLPMLPQRIAVISVETSKGYADFVKVIQDNPWGYRFFIMLFPSLLQGEKVGEAIALQLDRIERVKHHFDMVAIIRGGGGDVGLSGYNHLAFARKVALFPLPVITGIGHATNETVVEMVAFKHCITPTDVADFLIQQFHNFSAPLLDNSRILIELAYRILAFEKRNQLEISLQLDKSTRELQVVARNSLNAQARNMKGYTGFFIRNHRDHLQVKSGQVSKAVMIFFHAFRLKLEQMRKNGSLIIQSTLKKSWIDIESLKRNISLMDPINVLARGYSVTRLNGKIIRSHTYVNPGDSIETITFDGTIKSTVTTHYSEPGT